MSSFQETAPTESVFTVKGALNPLAEPSSILCPEDTIGMGLLIRRTDSAPDLLPDSRYSCTSF